MVFDCRLKRLYKTVNLTYVLSLHRIQHYVFGVEIGVLLHYTGKNVRIHRVFSPHVIIIARDRGTVLISGVSDLGMVERDNLGLMVVIFTLASGQTRLRV